MKGIILAAGLGTRLFPLTLSVSKQLLPIYDKPMIYYPLSVLLQSGIKDIAIITNPWDKAQFQKLLGTGESWGVKFTYIEQPSPDGLAQAFILAEDFIGEDSVCLVLGDNIYYGQGLPELFEKSSQIKEGATVFAYYVKDPERYGVVKFNAKKEALTLEEKPKKPKSNYAVTGLYYYDNSVIEIAKNLKPSPRGELEITDLNRLYLNMGKLNVEIMGRGCVWLDTGTYDSMLEAVNYVQSVQSRQGLQICCPEEVVWRRGYISDDQLLALSEKLIKTTYGLYLRDLVHENN
jgi:glucose-1-phosphate thymidylyltransferase